MEKWIFAVGYDKDKFAETQIEWLKYRVLIRMTSTFAEAIQDLTKNSNYLLIAIFSDNTDYLAPLKIIRGMTKAPILVVKQKYDGTEKIAAIEAGADEFIQWPETTEERVASGRALMRRYTELNQSDGDPPNVYSKGDVFISVEYHKVFICTEEIPLPRREFDLFYLLATNPNRVFKPDQLYREVWGADYIPTENSLHSCVRRIRRKLDALTKSPCQIQNVRGVGYYFSQENT